MPSQTSVTLHGTLVGRIWMPSREYSKPVTCDRQRDFRYSDGSLPTAREMVLHATNDGDFQSCQLTADSYFKFERDRYAPNGCTRIRRTKVRLVTEFPSIADCIDSRESCELDSDDDGEEVIR